MHLTHGIFPGQLYIGAVRLQSAEVPGRDDLHMQTIRVETFQTSSMYVGSCTDALSAHTRGIKLSA